MKVIFLLLLALLPLASHGFGFKQYQLGSSIETFTDADLGWCATNQLYKHGQIYPTGKNLFVSKDLSKLKIAPLAFCRLEVDGDNTIASKPISAINLNFSKGMLLEATLLVKEISMKELVTVFKRKFTVPWKHEIGPAGILQQWSQAGEVVSLLGLDVDLSEKTSVYIFYKYGNKESVPSMLEKRKMSEQEDQKKKALEDF